MTEAILLVLIKLSHVLVQDPVSAKN